MEICSNHTFYVSLCEGFQCSVSPFSLIFLLKSDKGQKLEEFLSDKTRAKTLFKDRAAGTQRWQREVKKCGCSKVKKRKQQGTMKCSHVKKKAEAPCVVILCLSLHCGDFFSHSSFQPSELCKPKLCCHVLFREKRLSPAALPNKPSLFSLFLTVLS